MVTYCTLVFNGYGSSPEFTGWVVRYRRKLFVLKSSGSGTFRGNSDACGAMQHANANAKLGYDGGLADGPCCADDRRLPESD